MKQKIFFLELFLSLLLLAYGCAGETSGDQVLISRVETMPRLPEPYKMLDWKEVAMNYDKYVFDHNLNGDHLPFIWLDESSRNFPQTTFGLYTAIGDVRQGPDVNNGEFHEAINSLGAIMGAGLVGIDKTNQNGYNYVKMVQNYFNSDNGWNIIMNNTSERVGHLVEDMPATGGMMYFPMCFISLWPIFSLMLKEPTVYFGSLPISFTGLTRCLRATIIILFSIICPWRVREVIFHFRKMRPQDMPMFYWRLTRSLAI